MALYSEKVMDHFQHPRNVGIIENADGIGEVGNAKCGDIMKIYLKIDDDKIEDVNAEIPEQARAKGEFVLHKGKKVHIKIRLQ